MRQSILFFALCSALDEISTFTILSNGGVELNPTVAWLIGINPLLYPLCDATLLLISCTLHELLIKRKVDLWYIWVAVGMIRLLCVALNIS